MSFLILGKGNRSYLFFTFIRLIPLHFLLTINSKPITNFFMKIVLLKEKSISTRQNQLKYNSY